MLSVDRKALLAALETLKTIAPKSGTMPVLSHVQLAADVKTVFARVRGVTLALHKVNATFPPYAQVIPAHSERTVTVARALLAEVVDAIGGCASDYTSGIKLDLVGDRLTVHAQDADKGEATEVVKVTCTGSAAPFKVGVNATYLKEALAECTGETVSLGLSGHLDPIVIRAEEGGVNVVMPMRI